VGSGAGLAVFREEKILASNGIQTPFRLSRSLASITTRESWLPFMAIKTSYVTMGYKLSHFILENKKDLSQSTTDLLLAWPRKG
jgi:hypothetical protein